MTVKGEGSLVTSLVAIPLRVQRALPPGMKIWSPTSLAAARQGEPGEVLEKGWAAVSHGAGMALAEREGPRESR